MCYQSLLECLLLQDPVIHEVEVEAFSHKGFSEHGYHLLIVRSLFEFQLSRVVKKVSELFGLALCQILDCCNCLLNFDLLVLLFLGLGR